MAFAAVFSRQQVARPHVVPPARQTPGASRRTFRRQSIRGDNQSRQSSEQNRQ
jgi:hypothetical protein